MSGVWGEGEGEGEGEAGVQRTLDMVETVPSNYDLFSLKKN